MIYESARARWFAAQTEDDGEVGTVETGARFRLFLDLYGRDYILSETVTGYVELESYEAWLGGRQTGDRCQDGWNAWLALADATDAHEAELAEYDKLLEIA